MPEIKQYRELKENGFAGLIIPFSPHPNLIKVSEKNCNHPVTQT
jgi:hypothetical protein